MVDCLQQQKKVVLTVSSGLPLDVRQAWKVESKDFSKQRNVMSPLEQAWKINSTNVSTHRKVVQRNLCHLYSKLKGPNKKHSLDTVKLGREIFSKLEQAWRINSTISLCTQDSCAEKWYATFMASLMGQINKCLST